jgi:hypothetical protein
VLFGKKKTKLFLLVFFLKKKNIFTEQWSHEKQHFAASPIQRLGSKNQ